MTAKQVGDAIDGKTFESVSGKWHISVLKPEEPAGTNTTRVVNLKLTGPISFTLRLEIPGEDLQRHTQDAASWLLAKLSNYVAHNPEIKQGESRSLIVND